MATLTAIKAKQTLIEREANEGLTGGVLSMECTFEFLLVTFGAELKSVDCFFKAIGFKDGSSIKIVSADNLPNKPDCGWFALVQEKNA